MLQQEDVRIWDGYDFLGADFSTESIIRKANAENNVKMKIINDLNCLGSIIKNISKTKEIYQFYLHEPFWEEEQGISYGIQILSTENISLMI